MFSVSQSLVILPPYEQSVDGEDLETLSNYTHHVISFTMAMI